MNTSIIATLLIPFAGTLIGSAFVFFMKKEMPALLQKALLGFASGVMVAASVWSLLIPSMEMYCVAGRCRFHCRNGLSVGGRLPDSSPSHRQ